LLGHENIVGRDASLPGVGQLAVGNTPGGRTERRAAFDDGGRFSAEFERDGGEILACRAHDRPSDGRAAGEQKMVERQAREFDADIGIARHDSHLILGEDLAQDRFHAG
jgi:hypothetical protein